MKTILALVVAIALLSGCATQPAPISGKAYGGSVAFGTLASFGTFEMELAPAYTRLAVLRHNAAKFLGDRKITRSNAQQIQETADRARFLLDEAHAQTLDGKPNAEAIEKLAKAKRLIQIGEQYLEGKS